ncbi:hypothetical protein FOZ62_021330, partial [Perkinsus olseni]
SQAPSLRLLVQELQTTKMLQAQRIDRLEQLLEQAGPNGSDGGTVDGLLSRQTEELERRIAELEGQLSQQILRVIWGAAALLRASSLRWRWDSSVVMGLHSRYALTDGSLSSA